MVKSTTVNCNKTNHEGDYNLSSDNKGIIMISNVIFKLTVVPKDKSKSS